MCAHTYTKYLPASHVHSHRIQCNGIINRRLITLLANRVNLSKQNRNEVGEWLGRGQEKKNLNWKLDFLHTPIPPILCPKMDQL